MVLAHDISKGDRTKDVKITQNITFETMLLAPNTIRGLKAAGFQKPSPVQLYGIPIGKCGFDLLLEAKSGTGKTAVFSIIALEKIDFRKGLQVIILTPTREIAAQICDVLKQIGSQYKELEVEVVMGGLPVQDDIVKFKKPVHIIVGSPGRLKHLIQHKYIDVNAVRLLVFDEADKLMEKSFQTDVKYIHSTLPKQKQVIMSSATYPEITKALINSYVQNANHVCPDSDCILLGIDQKVSFVKYNSNIIKYTQDRFKELQQILSKLQFKQCLVFCNFQTRVAEVDKLLKKNDWPSQKLHGQQEQIDRLDALKTLQQYKCRILVATDLAARGIDASNIDLVVNFEPPYDWQTYLHRIGRAGRFGSYGTAITILSQGKELHKFKEMFNSMNLSLNLRHLWSHAEFDINNSPKEQCNLSAGNVKNNDFLEKPSCTDIWQMLSSKYIGANCTETFDVQCILTPENENFEIEPFSELIVSFDDSYQDNGDDVVFKHLEMGKISGYNSKSLDSENIVKHVKCITSIEINKKNKEEDIHDREPSEELNGDICNTCINDSDNIKNSTTHETNASEQNDIDNALFSSEPLPTEFSSTNGKNHDKEQGILLKQFEISTINNDEDKLNTNIKRNIPNENGTKVDQQCDETDKLNEKENKFKFLQQKKKPRSYIRKDLSKYHTQLKTNAKLYADWYNELKTRTAYVQQTVYINEMSKC